MKEQIVAKHGTQPVADVQRLDVETVHGVSRHNAGAAFHEHCVRPLLKANKNSTQDASSTLALKS